MLNKGKMIGLDEKVWHTFDSYYKNVICIGNNLIIPYVNIGVSDLESTQTKTYIDRCYVVLISIDYLELYKIGVVIETGRNKSKHELFFGGLNLENEDIFVDIDVKCNGGGVFLLPDSKISTEMWIPIITPNLKQNMHDKIVESFFNHSVKFII